MVVPLQVRIGVGFGGGVKKAFGAINPIAIFGDGHFRADATAIAWRERMEAAGHGDGGAELVEGVEF